MIFHKDAKKNSIREKNNNIISTNGYGMTEYLYKKHSYFTPYIKINLKCIITPDVKPKTINPLYGNKSNKLSNLGVIKLFYIGHKKHKT